MRWSSLFAKIKKLPFGVQENETVVVVLERSYLEKLLREKRTSYQIPVSAKTGTGRQKMWLIHEEKK